MKSSLHSIFYKCLIYFLALSIVPLIFSSWLTFRYFSDSLTQKLDQNASFITEQKMGSIFFYLNDLQRMKFLISNDAVVSQFLKTNDLNEYRGFFFQLDPFFDSIQAIRPENVGITLINEYGYVYYYGYSFNRGHAGFDSYSWMPALSNITQQPYITSVHDRPYSYTDGAEDRVFSYIQQIWSSDLKFKGTLLIDFQTDIFDSIFADTSLLEDEPDKSVEGMIVTDRDGNLLYPSNDPFFAAEELAQLNHDGGIGTFTRSGHTYLLLHRYDPITEWTFTAYFLEEKLYQPMYALRTITILIIVACVLICLLVSWLFSRRISLPIKQLLNYIRNVGRGDFTPPFRLRRKDELGTLSDEFNVMVEKLKDLLDRVHREQNEKRRAEVTALQLQINPHFLYNTLESISSLARKKKEREISRMIVLLGKLFRQNIGTFEEMIPIGKELTFITYYLEIHQMRLHRPFEYHIDIQEELLDLYTIKWILQPIVENAVLHGGNEQGTFIDIVGRMNEEDVLLQIQDRGKGIAAPALSELRNNLEHHYEDLSKYKGKIGLYNVQSRIRLHYGPRYGLQVDSAPLRGTTVTITLPRRTQADAQETVDR